MRFAIVPVLPFLLACAALSLACGRDAGARAELTAMPAHASTPAKVAQGALIASVAKAASDCASCHRTIAAEWQTSLHRASHDDPSYQAALDGEPRAFCNACHAPAETAALGVACTTCHTSAHEPAAVSVEAKTRSCASCHEFAFPDGKGEMQRTASEHRASAHASTSCESCHMPHVGEGKDRHKSHVFLASRDENMLRRSLAVHARPLGPGTVEVILRATDVGHAVPTGDMFRRLVVRAEALDAKGQVVGRAERVLARHFDRDGHGFREIDDDRPGGRQGAEIRVPLDLGERALDARVRYRVEHQRVKNSFRASSRVEAAIAVAEGEVSP